MARTKADNKLGQHKKRQKTNVVQVNTRKSNPVLKHLPNVLEFHDSNTGRTWFLKRYMGSNLYKSDGVELRLKPEREIIAQSIYHNMKSSGTGIRKQNNLPASAIVSVLKSGLVPTATVVNSSYKIFGNKRIPRIYLNNSNDLYPDFTPGHNYIPIREIARSFVSENKLNMSKIRNILEQTYEDFPYFPKFTPNKVKLMHTYSGLSLDSKKYHNALNETGLIAVAPFLQLTRQYPPFELPNLGWNQYSKMF